MKLGKDRKGFSMVEIIIVLAILGILAGATASLIGHVRYNNTKKAAERIDTAIGRVQMEAMSKQEIPYLYIYALSDGYYYKMLPASTPVFTFDSSVFTSDGTKICGKDIDIYKGGSVLSGSNFIRIVYNRSGALSYKDITNGATTQWATDAGTRPPVIQVKGRGSYEITIVEETGKHFLEKK